MNDVNVTMPQLGETVAEGTVSRWLHQVGDEVRAHEPLLEVSTDKVDTEVVAPAAGVLASIVVGESETVPVGALLATIAVGPSAPVGEKQVSDPGSSGHRHTASPRARRLARELGVHLATVSATGNGRMVTADDVTNAAIAKQSAPSLSTPALPASASKTFAPMSNVTPNPELPASGRTMPRDVAIDVARQRVEKLSHRRRLIAERMTQSLHTSAQLTTVVEVDLTRVTQVRAQARQDFVARQGAPLTVLAFVAEAALYGLSRHPLLSAQLDLEAGTITYSDDEHLGVAVDTDKGLVVPVIRSAGDLSVGGLARRIADMARRTREESISADELTGGTFTITNTGSRGALFDTPIINQPQAAILGFGAIVRRPVIVADTDGEESIAIRSMAYLALTYDHRLVDGADAARYLGTVKARLEDGGGDVA